MTLMSLYKSEILHDDYKWRHCNDYINVKFMMILTNVNM